ncbi:MAG: hypothetical protein LC730_01585, partial [Acidobacteria bacterium]|nr:hypothetical protein [Acidobacteriota bacterium]MCA1608136.1 hypothetical protein [Acidobacteriota bacterium]
MQNDVNNETGTSTTGETPAVETKQQDQPAVASVQAPVTETAAETVEQQASITQTAEPQAPVKETAEPQAPRIVKKPVAELRASNPAPAEEASGDVDFGAILEQFE